MPDSPSPLRPTERCPHCGAAVCAHDRFCLACGSALHEPGQAYAAAAKPPPNATANAGKQPLLAVRRALLLLGLFLLGGLIGYLLAAAF